MRISDVLRVKGAQVVTVTPDTKVRRLVAVLAEHRIGAVTAAPSSASLRATASPMPALEPVTMARVPSSCSSTVSPG
jgi:CBS domain-containing protein